MPAGAGAAGESIPSPSAICRWWSRGWTAMAICGPARSLGGYDRRSPAEAVPGRARSVASYVLYPNPDAIWSRFGRMADSVELAPASWPPELRRGADNRYS